MSLGLGWAAYVVERLMLPESASGPAAVCQEPTKVLEGIFSIHAPHCRTMPDAATPMRSALGPDHACLPLAGGSHHLLHLSAALRRVTPHAVL